MSLQNALSKKEPLLSDHDTMASERAEEQAQAGALEDNGDYMDGVMGVGGEQASQHDSNSSNANTAAGITLPKTKSGIFGTSSNLVNSIVGAGIIGLPYAFRESGLIAGLILLILVGYLTGE